MPAWSGGTTGGWSRPTKWSCGAPVPGDTPMLTPETAAFRDERSVKLGSAPISQNLAPSRRCDLARRSSRSLISTLRASWAIWMLTTWPTVTPL